MTKIKVLILTEGGGQIGLGHITRCLALFDAFKQQGCDLQFALNDHGDTKTALGQREKIITNWQEKAVLKQLLANIDIVVVDSYLAEKQTYDVVQQASQLCLFLDDNLRLHYPAGVIVNGMIEAEKLDYPKNNQNTYLLGAQYTLLRQSFAQIKPKKTNQRIKEILITFGGDDKKKMTPVIIKMIKASFLGLRLNVILGKNFYQDNVDQIKHLLNENIHLYSNPSAYSIKSLMERSDIAVSACGQTINELAASGVPTIGIAVVDNQLNNAYAWQRIGFLQYAGWWQDKVIEQKVKELIFGLAPAAKRAKLSKIGQSIIDGEGPQRVVTKALELLST